MLKRWCYWKADNAKPHGSRVDTGEIIDPPSDVDAFVAAAQQVLADREGYHQRVLADRSRLESQYSLDAMTRSTVELWREVLKGGLRSEASVP